MHTKRRWIMLGTLLLCLTAAGCKAPAADGRGAVLAFETSVQVRADQVCEIRLGARNAGDVPFPGDERFGGRMTLSYAGDERGGELRARAEIVTLATLEPDETAWPMVWRGRLDPGAYSLVWGAEGYGLTRVAFEIVERDGQLTLGA